MTKCFWNPATLEVAYNVRPSDGYSVEGTEEEYQALVASLPPRPEPDWTAFNAVMLQNTNWQTWTALLPEQLVAGIVAASTMASTEKVQSSLTIAYSITDPGEASKVEWQAIADTNNVPVTF